VKYYWGSKIEVTEGVRGFCGDRSFRVVVEADVHSDDESLEVTLSLGEDELRKLMKQIQDVLEADR
jgi:hypothetical protein